MKFNLVGFFFISVVCIEIVAFQFKQVVRVNRFEHEKPITLFSHGLSADYQQADFYANLFCSKNYVSFNYPDAPEKLFVRNENTGPAQQSEMHSFSHVMNAVLGFDDQVVLYGVSRGASVIINVVGSFIETKKPMPSLKAIVLESPFAHCEDVILGYAKQFNLPPFFMRFLAKRFFKEYHPKKNAPIDFVAHISQDIPILFICTKDDIIVPVQSTRRLYTRLREAGHKKVHLLEFSSGMHANIVWGTHGREYHAVVNAFYCAYNLPHDVELAAIGKARFALCQPEI